MSLRFAFYGRVSTEDAQDPEASRSWQKRRAMDLITPHGGFIAADYFDVGQSRSLPWKRRPEASRLLADVACRDRSFDAVVIGEPARAFYGPQFALTFLSSRTTELACGYPRSAERSIPAPRHTTW
ncbi:hypothetical protein MTIM_53070 [Mycobacterium timonense]|uniref:Resolvase/invertase-type recombinase catalytic domain-containing protein n=1 Tax=Mycobacterium timonense TaxID=701043 RepID=A0A7I9ZF10_9MYCO|nr:hypothetical protein MTIM_53070 [Mycobacterium timonense]